MNIREIRKIEWQGKNKFIKVSENLYVEVTKSKKVFKVIFKVQQKQIKATIGDVNDITLTQAKQKVLNLKSKIANKNFNEAREIIRKNLAKKQSKKDKELQIQKEKEENKYKLETLLRKYIVYLEEKGADKKKIARVRNYLLPLLGSYDVRTITHTDIINNFFKKIKDVKFRNDKRSKNKKETARKLKYILADFFNYCMLYYSITNNPVLLIKNSVLDDLFGEDKIENIKTVTELKELQNIYNKILENKTNARKCTVKLIQFIFLTALRFNTAYNLKYSFVNYDKKIMLIPKELMKTRKDFVLPLTDTLLKIIKEMKECSNSDYIFACKDTKMPSSNASINEYLKKISNNGMTIHGVRSSFETIMLERGENFIYVSAQLSHSLKRVTGVSEIEKYNRSNFLEQRRELLQRWEDLLTAKTP